MAATALSDGVPASGIRRNLSLRRLVSGLVALLIYGLLACLVFWPHGPLEAHRLPGCGCSDPAQGAWFTGWVPFALSHGHNPLFTSYLNAPHGANLAANTSSPLLGVLAWPVTATLGPVASYNLLLRLGLGLSAFAMYLFLRRYARWWPAAFSGGLLYGFSPFVVGHARYHMFLVFIPLVPLLAALVDDWLVRATRTPWKSGLLIGVVATLQFLISPEVLAIAAIFIGVGLLALAFLRRAEVAARLRPLLQGAAFALMSFAILAGYPAWMLVAGPQRPKGPLHPLTNSLNNYRADLLGLVVPTHGELLAPHPIVDMGNRFTNHQLIENGFYLGFPLLILLAYVAWRFRRQAIVSMSVVVFAVGFVFSLGIRLDVAGHRSHFPLPFVLVTHLPIVQNIAAARLSLVIQFAAALLLGVGLDRVRAARRVGRDEPQSMGRWRAPRRLEVVLVAIGVAALLPVVPETPLREFRADVPAFFTTSQVNVIPKGTLALTYPFDRQPVNDPMLWQMSSGFRFRIFGGEAWVPDMAAGGRSTTRPLWPVPHRLLRLFIKHRVPHPTPKPVPADVRALDNFVLRRHVDVIIVRLGDSQAADVSALVRLAFGAPSGVYRGVVVWVKPRPVSAKQAISG